MNQIKLVLGVHPTSRGFGWALFESPIQPLFWGIVETRTHRNRDALAAFRVLLDRYQPEMLAMEQFEHRPARRNGRIKKLGAALVALAHKQGLQSAILPRAAIGIIIAQDSTATRYEIAQTIANKVEALAYRMPAKRKPWESEKPNLSIFSAAACALTWYANH